ncbi:MAG: CarD family transcriptional regulator, partial [Acidimicrobiales bacterium]
RTMWRLSQGSVAGSGGDEVGPTVVVASVKALIQRLGLRAADAAPVVVARGDRMDPEDFVARLAALGYRREYQVEHRGELAVRGGIIDVFPSTSASAVRIDLWGDEVDRLTSFDVGDQRSVADVDQATIFGCRELMIGPSLIERASDLLVSQAWGAGQWERLSEGQSFDGMESWLPWLVTEEHLLADLLGPRAQVLLFDPRRMRDRAGELADEEAAVAGSLAQTWGAEGEFPRLHLGFDRLLARTEAPVWSAPAVAEGPDVPSVAATGWDPVVGDHSQLVARLLRFKEEGWRVVICADGPGSAARLAQVLAEEGMTVPVVGGSAVGGSAVEGSAVEGSAVGGSAVGGSGELAQPGIRVVVQPLDRGFVYPPARLAVLAEPDITGRRRAHRRARPRARVTEGFFDDLAVGDYVVHATHGVARYAGMVKRSIGGAERDYLLLEYRGDDKLYIPSDQIDAITPYSGGETPSVSRLGGSDWSRTKARVKAAVSEVAQELVVLYRRRVTSPGHAYPPDTPWQAEMESGFGYIETPDQAKAIDETKADMELAVPMDRLVCGDVGFGKTEIAIRAAFKA